jgi:hypothetical protein
MKNILQENMKRFATKNLTQLPGLDPVLDTAHCLYESKRII